MKSSKSKSVSKKIDFATDSDFDPKVTEQFLILRLPLFGPNYTVEPEFIFVN